MTSKEPREQTFTQSGVYATLEEVEAERQKLCRERETPNEDTLIE